MNQIDTRLCMAIKLFILMIDGLYRFTTREILVVLVILMNTSDGTLLYQEHAYVASEHVVRIPTGEQQRLPVFVLFIDIVSLFNKSQYKIIPIE